MIRFDRFELSPATRQLFRDGAPVSLEPQPAALLVLLVTRAGELIAHDEIRQHLWGADTHVNYQEGLHYSVRQVRLALGDVARDSRYIETVPRRGYRFRAVSSTLNRLRRCGLPGYEGHWSRPLSPGSLRLGSWSSSDRTGITTSPLRGSPGPMT